MMLQSDIFGKLTLAISTQELESALFLIASRSIAQIKEVSSVPSDFKRLQLELFKIGEDENTNQDFNTRDFKIQILKKKLEEIGENLSFIAKKLEIKPAAGTKPQYEFHIKDLDDLIDKLFETTKGFYVRVQKLMAGMVSTENAIDVARLRDMVFNGLSTTDLRREYIDGLQLIHLKLAVASTKNAGMLSGELAGGKLYVHELRLNENNVLFIIAAIQDDLADVNRKLDLYNAKVFELTDKDFLPDGSLDREQARLDFNRLVKERAYVDIVFKQTRQELEYEIIAMQELHQNAIKFLHNHEKIQFFKNFVIAEFWVREKDWQHLKDALESTFGDRVQFIYRAVDRAAAVVDAGHGDDPRKKAEEPPTYVSVPRILQPYTTILKLYGLPQYSEVNPLLVIFISFPLLFGLMFGDVGQGLCLMLAGLLIARLFKARQGYHNLGMVIFWCGAGAVFGGFVYGDVFGYPIIDITVSGVRVFPWFHPFPEPGEVAMFGVGTAMQLLTFTIWIGTFQMTAGFVLRIFNYALVKRYYLILVDPIPKLVILWDIWLAIQAFGLDIMLFMSPEFLLSTRGILLIGAVLVLVFGQVIGKAARVAYLRQKPAGSLIGEQGMDLFETFLSFLSNALSYTRIFAMTMVHLGFIFAVRLIADQLSVAAGNAIWVFVLVYAVGSGLVVALELILVLIQNIRLHFYEFFSKFYKGGGQEFKLMRFDVRFSKIYFDNSERFIIEMPGAARAVPVAIEGS